MREAPIRGQDHLARRGDRHGRLWSSRHHKERLTNPTDSISGQSDQPRPSQPRPSNRRLRSRVDRALGLPHPAPHDPRDRSPNPLKVNYGWAAGFIDADGCISFSKGQTLPRLKVTGVHHGTLKRLRKELGGEIYRRAPTDAGKDCWEWCVFTQAELTCALNAIYPELVCKKKQAFLVLKHLSTRQLHPGVPYSSKELDAQERLRKQLRLLNL